jgi:RNA polymerase sigma-70 factor (ECF subfamily)
MQVAPLTEDLVLRALRGEARAFEELVRRHLRPAYSVALAVLGSPADAEDVSQDAFAAAFERLDSCREPAKFAAWLLQIVRNRARNAAYARRVRGEHAKSPAEAERVQAPAAERAGLRSRLLKALSALSPQQREVVLLHDLDGWTHGEIAAALGLSEVMSRQHLFVARKQLRGELGDEAPKEASDER